MSDESQWLTQRFEDHRGHLRGVAYRVLGSLNEAEDAVQEAWLRLSRSGAEDIDNLGGWLTTVVGRVCLDMLRSRKSRGEEALEDASPPRPTGPENETDPEQEAMLADSVGLALLVVLDTLDPAERLAFVLHDMFDLSFDEIAPIVGRSEVAARQLASRARRRVRGAGASPNPDLARQREVVEAFLTAARAGDFEGLLAVLDPEVVHRVDAAGLPAGVPRETRGAALVARRSLAGSGQAAALVALALIDGSVGVVLAPRGHLRMAIRFTVHGGKIAEIDVISSRARLRGLDLGVLPERVDTKEP